jgi:predicted nuclease with RNAse H fold
VKFIGIDLAGSPNRPTGFCVADSRMRVECKVLHTDKEILEAVKMTAAKVAAIDAPLALPKGRHCLKEHCRGRVHFRACDRVLTRMRIRYFPITIGPMRMLTSRGILLAKRLRQLGVESIETFPGGAQDILGIPRKQVGLEALRRALAGICTGDVERELTGDELDAINCALVAKEYASGSYLAIGDPSEILMILPRPNSMMGNVK